MSENALAQKTLEGLQQVVKKLTQGQDAEGLNVLINVLDSINIETIVESGKRNDLNKTLSNILISLEQGDYVRLVDSVQYSLIPLIRR